MNRFRSQLLAILGAAALMSLSVSGALGHSPWGDGTRGQQASAYVHGLVGGDEDSAGADANESDDEAEDDEDAIEQGEPGAHGACVSEVARGDEVGGENENHGGAVSLAARESCWEDPTGEEPATEEADEADDRNHGQGKPEHDDADDDD